jgi:glycosyltransferase involved in cell wall biosynthesis
MCCSNDEFDSPERRRPMGDIRILQNQDRFTTKEYKQYVTPLISAVKKSMFLRYLTKFPRNGFVAGILMYFTSKKYNVIVTVGHRAAMTYGALNRLLPRKGKIHIAKEFYFEGNGKRSIRRYLLNYVYLFSFKSLTAVVVNSSKEIRPYAKGMRVPEAIFHFIPWPSSVDKPQIIESHENYILAVGRSLRDWKTLFAAIQGLDHHVVVVASRKDMKNLKIPDNVTLFIDVSYDKYIELLKHAKFVVLPLVETQRSTGQASFLEAMGYGKPVIISKVVGALDYVEDGINGLYYAPGNERELRSKIIRLSGDIALQKEIGLKGLESIKAKFNKECYAKEMINMVKNVARTRLCGLT